MKKLSATLAMLAALSGLPLGPGALAQSSPLYDVQFEANGLTYTLYDQSFPLELSVDYSGYGSFRDVFDFLYMVEALDHFTQYSESLYQSGDEASLSSNAYGGFTLTISRPFTGTIDLTGEYEYEEPFMEYDPELDDYVEHFYTSFGSYGITISVPGYGTPYDTWAATNGLAAADAVTDGTPNLIRYVFNCPTNACNPFAEISFVNGKPVVKTLAPVHTDGVSISLLSSTNLTDWSQADELDYTDFGPNGELIFEHDTDDPVRFYRLKVEE